MLEQAKLLNTYSSLQLADFSKLLDIEVATYEAIISVGVYSSRFKKTYLPEMLRVLMPGGYFVFSFREQFFEEVSEQIRELHESSTISEASYRLDDYMTG